MLENIFEAFYKILGKIGVKNAVYIDMALNQKNKNFNYKPAGMFQELERMEKELSELQKKIAASKLGGVGESLLTVSNLKESIKVFKKINKEDKNLINALHSLMPLAEKTDEELEQISRRQRGNVPESQRESGTSFTSKIKCKLPQNRLI